MEITIVRTVDALGDDYLDRDAVDRFAELKGRTLGYVEASIKTPVAAGQYFSSLAPLGAVCNQEDAERLIAAICTEFPGINFRTEQLQYENAEEVVWHRIR